MPSTAHLLCLALLLSSLCASLSVAIQQHKIHLVDQWQDRNFLVRGDQPRNDSIPFSQCGGSGAPHDPPQWMCFGYEQLLQYTRAQLLQEAGVRLPARVWLLDVSLLGPQGAEETLDLQVERAFFRHDPTRGQLLHWPLWGQKDHCPVQAQTQEQVLQLASTSLSWMADDLGNLTARLRTLLHTPADLPVLIYVHCEHGMDRTGELSGAYSMRYLGQSYPEVVKYNDAVGNRPQMPENKCAMHWYCYYLSLHDRLTTVDCGGADGDTPHLLTSNTRKPSR